MSGLHSTMITLFLYRQFHTILEGSTATALDVAIYMESSRTRKGLAAKPFWECIADTLGRFGAVLQSADDIPCFKTVQRKMTRLTVAISMTACFQRRSTELIQFVRNQDKIPRRRFPIRKWRPVYTIASVNIEDLLSFHAARHKGTYPTTIDISYDGVEENRSSGRSLEILSGQFGGCREVYPLSVGVAEKQFTSDMKANEVCGPSLVAIRKAKIGVRIFICDHPKRAELRGQVNCAGYYACDLCFIRAERQFNKMVYPHGRVAEERTHARHVQLSQRSNSNDSEHDYFGIRRSSFLLEVLPELDIIEDIPVDYMHTVLLGNVKRALNLTFESVKGKKKLAKFSEAYENVRLPREFPRKTRTINLADFKANEYRTLATVVFPLFFTLFDDDDDDIRRLRTYWLLTGYTLRAFMVPEEEYRELDKSNLQNLMKRWQRSHEDCFGLENCVYNVHLWGAHALKIRERGPLTNFSCFRFEDAYMKIGTAHRGTFNKPKQVWCRGALRHK